MPYWLLITWNTIGSFHTADVGRAVAELAQHDAVGAGVVERERRADRDRQVPADDAPAAEEAPVDVEQVHRAAVAAGDAGRLAEQLGHHAGRLGADRQRRAVVAVAREQVVGLAERLDGADVGRLLADREVAVAADPGPRVLLLRALLEAADQHHLAEDAPRRRGIAEQGLMLGD
jgi:hypothetical protein